MIEWLAAFEAFRCTGVYEELFRRLSASGDRSRRLLGRFMRRHDYHQGAGAC